MGICQATFFRWKKVYGGLMPSEVRRLKQLEEENARLRKLVADLTLDKEMLSEVIKKDLTAVRGREMIDGVAFRRRPMPWSTQTSRPKVMKVILSSMKIEPLSYPPPPLWPGVFTSDA